MIRTFVLGLALGALALPAVAATSITINIANLDSRTAHARIAEAADKACRAEYQNMTALEAQYDFKGCVADSTAAAEAQLAVRRATLAKL